MTTPTVSQEVTGPPPLKSGIASSEFWLVLIGTVVSLLVGLNVVGPNFADKYKQVIDSLALLASVVGPSFYALARGNAKRGHQQAVASVLTASITANASMVAQGINPQVAAASTKAAVATSPTPADSGYSLVAVLAYVAALILVVVGVISIVVAAVARHSHVSGGGVIAVVVGLIIAFLASALDRGSPRL